MKTYRSTALGPRVLLLVLLSLGVSQFASAQTCWVVGGGSLALDPEDTPYASSVGPHMQVLDTAPFPVTIGARGSLTGLPQDNFVSKRYKYFQIRFRDNGTLGKMYVSLRQANLLTGAVTVLSTIDTDLLPASNDYQVVYTSASTCAAGQGFDFWNNLYFVRVEITRTGVGGTPSLSSIQICDVPC